MQTTNIEMDNIQMDMITNSDLSKITGNAQNGDKNCHFGPKMTKLNKNIYFPQKQYLNTV